MGKIIKDTNDNGEHEEFLHGLQAMYNGTKKWGSVRLTLKRSKFNKSKLINSNYE